MCFFLFFGRGGGAGSSFWQHVLFVGGGGGTPFGNMFFLSGGGEAPFVNMFFFFFWEGGGGGARGSSFWQHVLFVGGGELLLVTCSFFRGGGKLLLATCVFSPSIILVKNAPVHIRPQGRNRLGQSDILTGGHNPCLSHFGLDFNVDLT